MNKILTKLTKVILDIFFFGGLIVCFTLPFSLKVVGRWYETYDKYYIQMCIVFFVTGMASVYILGQLRNMFRTVLLEDCFVKENVISLKNMGIASIVVAVATAIRLFFVITPATLITIIIFAIAGLFSFVLSQVFEQAVTYKLENDLTI